MAKTNFRRLSNKEAKEAALNDMKKENVNHFYIQNQSLILNQPVITYRMGLFGL